MVNTMSYKTYVLLPLIALTLLSVGQPAFAELSIQASAITGSSTLIVSGTTDKLNQDITFVIVAPNGNIVEVDQLKPDNGSFTLTTNIGGELWKQDGIYTVKAQQTDNILYMDTVQVDIKDGVIIPEFGGIAMMILVVAIVSIIVVTTKARVIPRF